MRGERFLTKDRYSEVNEVENPTPFNIRYLQNQVTETNDGSKDYETYTNYLSANELEKPAETNDGSKDYETYTNYLSANELEKPAETNNGSKDYETSANYLKANELEIPTPFNIQYLRNEVKETGELNEPSYKQFSPEYDIDEKKVTSSSEVVPEEVL